MTVRLLVLRLAIALAAGFVVAILAAVAISIAHLGHRGLLQETVSSLSYPAGNPHGFSYEPWHWSHRG